MKAYLCIDPAGRILETGMVSDDLWSVTGPHFPHCARYEISHEIKLAIEGEGHARFFASLEDEPGIDVGRDVSGALFIKRKPEIKLSASKTTFRCGEQIELTHDGANPVKIWAARRPIAGAHKGKVHPSKPARMSAGLPGYYEIEVRDPRHWAEPIEVCALAEKQDG